MFTNAACNETKYDEVSKRFARLCERTNEEPAGSALVIVDSMLVQVSKPYAAQEVPRNLRVLYKCRLSKIISHSYCRLVPSENFFCNNKDSSQDWATHLTERDCGRAGPAACSWSDGGSGQLDKLQHNDLWESFRYYNACWEKFNCTW